MSFMPFSGFVDLEDLKTTLLSLAVDPSIGGLLILGPKGTGKSSLVRAFAELLPDMQVVIGCSFGCSPRQIEELCDDCSAKLKQGGKLPQLTRRMSIVELPIGVTDDRVIGSINVERTLSDGKLHFEPGLLARAHRNILYIDEVNLLPDHIVDLILDAAAYGWNVVEREGVSLRHPARFILVGTMNPEEGELRPQLLDRFAISLPIQTVLDPQLRADIVKRNIEFETNHDLFNATWFPSQNKIRGKIENAREHIKEVYVSDQIISIISQVCGRLSVDGYRPDIVATKVARALAALDGGREVSQDDALKGLKLALAHRTRAGGLKPPATQLEIEKQFQEARNMQFGKIGQPSQPAPTPASDLTGQQRKSILNARRTKEGPTAPQNLSQPRRRGLGRLFSLVFLLAGATFLYVILPFWTFVALMTLFLLIVLIISLVRRNKGGTLSPYPNTGRPSRTRAEKVAASSSVLAWPSARKILGKKITEGEQLIEKSSDDSTKAKFELDKIISRARWLGRRKGLTGRGRPVSYKNFSDRTNRDIAVAASVRLAARRGRPFRVRKEDLRTKIREGRVKASMILVLDSSESMIDSLNKVRDAIRAVKKGATRMRDRVGLIVFKGEEAHVLQHPTTNFNLIMQKLTNVGLSDFTPLAAGIMRAARLARAEEARGYAPIVVMATDGVANVSIPRWSSRIYEIPDPAADALLMAKSIAVNKWKTVVANMAHVKEDGPADMVMGTHLMMNIAFVTKGVYVGFSRKKDEATVHDMSQRFAELDDLNLLQRP
jgi:Mg-chelatase subunit ChlI/Mg-chelatase subunit ChlD